VIELKHDLIERYIYAVVHRLPEHQREDIAKELRSLIDDMLQSSDPTEEEIETVLKELGNPNELSEQYREKKRYLIGPNYFHHYLLVLKIVGLAVFFGITLSFVINLIINQNPIENNIADYIGTVIQALVSAFAWVTIIFAFVDYYDVEMNDSKEKSWNLKNLPLIPEQKARISPVESLFGIMFISIFMAILFFAPEILAAYLKNDHGEVTQIPIFVQEQLVNMQVLLIAIFMIAITSEILKLIYRKWTFKLALITSILKAINLCLSILLLLNPSIWNPEFKEIVHLIPLDISWKDILHGFIGIIVVINVIEIASTLYKGIRYRN
jgi:uncharacterized membrane protein YhdT